LTGADEGLDSFFWLELISLLNQILSPLATPTGLLYQRLLRNYLYGSPTRTLDC
jgi:hypothetical protein